MIYTIRLKRCKEGVDKTILIKNTYVDVVIDGIEAVSLDGAFKYKEGGCYDFARTGAYGIMALNNNDVILNGAPYPYVDVLGVFNKEEFERELAGTIDEELDNLHMFVKELDVSSKEVAYEFLGTEVFIRKIMDEDIPYIRKIMDEDIPYIRH